MLFELRNAIFWCLIGLLAFVPNVAFADALFELEPERRSRPVGRSLLHIPTGSPLAKPDQMYRDYFSPLDNRIKREYRDRWDFHDKRIAFAAEEWRYEHFSIGSLDYYGRAPYEGDVRNRFAQRVLQARIDTAIKKYFEKPNRAPKLKRAHKKIKQLQNVQVAITAKQDSPKFQFGYDVFTDATKVEYVSSLFSFGMYHPHLVSSLIGTRQIAALTMNLTTPLGFGLPAANLGYSLGSGTVNAGLSRSFNLSAKVSTTLSTHFHWDSLDSVQGHYGIQFSFGL